LSSLEYNNAIKTIDECSIDGKSSSTLYDAVRYIDKNALKLYPDEESKSQLWDRAYGSWKLVLATGGGRFTEFKPVPIFAFGMLDENNFGNGIGLNKDKIILSLLGPHELVTKRRQMIINIDDIFLGANKVTDFTPGFIKQGMGLGKRPADYKKDGRRPPAFTFIAASEKSLVARGGSGGIAIWTRLDNDIRPAAYSSLSS
ncbi:unnamed protein product, partial [Heterosigma akashiwo]